MSRGNRKSRENSHKRESSRLTFRKKSKGLGLFPASDFDGVCTQNQCLLSADFVFQEPRRAHILSKMVYKCALAIASGIWNLFILKKFHLNSKRYVRTSPESSDFSFLGTYVHTFFTWNEKIYSLSSREKNNRPNCQRLSLTAQADFYF